MFVEQRTTGRRPRHLHTPETLEEAADLLAQHAGQVRIAAGCTYLMLMAAHGESLPEHLVMLHRVPGLDGREPGRIGAAVTLRALERGPLDGPERALTMAAAVTAGPSVRTLGTLGGNLGFADGDVIPAAMALGATAHLDDGASVPVADFVSDRPVGRIVTGISHEARTEDGWTGATVKLSRRAMDWPIVTVSTALRVADGGEILACRTAAQALAPEPTLLPAVDAVLVGSHGEEEALEYAAQAATERLEVRADLEASASYRKRVAPAVVRRALDIALHSGPTGTVDLREARR